MSLGICYIFGAGESTPCTVNFSANDFIIAADGGYDYATKIGISPHISIGDFDSSASDTIPESHIIYPAEKDDTDMMLAIKYGLKKGYRNFHIYGGLGGRLDHTLANLQSLSYLAASEARGVLWGNKYAITSITNDSLSISGKKSDYISIFCLSDFSYGVTLENLKYPLTNATLSNANCISVSNQFTEKPAKIKVEKGTLAILWYF